MLQDVGYTASTLTHSTPSKTAFWDYCRGERKVFIGTKKTDVTRIYSDLEETPKAASEEENPFQISRRKKKNM